MTLRSLVAPQIASDVRADAYGQWELSPESVGINFYADEEELVGTLDLTPEEADRLADELRKRAADSRMADWSLDRHFEFRRVEEDNGIPF